MPAKLDTSKPLRLIGIQIYEGTHANVRKVLEPGWYPFIRCENTDEDARGQVLWHERRMKDEGRRLRSEG